jgi:hypothetical protein
MIKTSDKAIEELEEAIQMGGGRSPEMTEYMALEIGYREGYLQALSEFKQDEISGNLEVAS